MSASRGSSRLRFAICAAVLLLLLVTGCTPASTSPPRSSNPSTPARSVPPEASSGARPSRAPGAADTGRVAESIALLRSRGWHPEGASRVTTVTVQLNNLFGTAVAGASEAIGLTGLRALAGEPLIQYSFVLAERSSVSPHAQCTGSVLFSGSRLVGAFAEIPGYRGPFAALSDHSQLAR